MTIIGDKKWRVIFILVLLLLFILVIFVIFGNKENDNEYLISKRSVSIDLNQVRSYYHDFVKIHDGVFMYIKSGNDYQGVSQIHGTIEVSLDSSYSVRDEYFKVLDSEYYVRYDEVIGIDYLSNKEGEYQYYQNYIPYNENIELNNHAKLYVDDVNYYEVQGGSYAIIIKDDYQYGIEYNHGLVYVKKEDVKRVIEHVNTNQNYADGLAVLNYHYVVSGSNENLELDECQQSICITDTMFDSHMKYLKDNGYYGVSMRDLELFIDGKIQLPEKSVCLTFDDGWYVAREIAILEKYQILGTLFLIGSLASPDDYVSSYLEVHSHSWNMHKLGDCPSSVGRGGILCLDEDTILEDLRLSRESLNNTTYFCYPFYDYNDRAIQLLKQAGFTMAFAGELKDSTVRVGQDKYRIPRYVIINSTTMEQFIQYVS